MRVEEEDEEVSGITGSMVRALPFALPFAKSSDDPNIASGCGEIQSSQSILSQWRRSTHPINRPTVRSPVEHPGSRFWQVNTGAF